MKIDNGPRALQWNTAIDGTGLIFRNAYNPATASSSPSGEGAYSFLKAIDDVNHQGRTPAANEFLFELRGLAAGQHEASEDASEVHLLATNESAGTGATARVEFPAIAFEREGTYAFTVRELRGNDSTIATWDSAERILISTVTRQGDELNVQWHASGQAVNDGARTITFTNTTAPATTTVSVTKQWSGDTDAQGNLLAPRPSVSVRLLDANNAPVLDSEGHAYAAQLSADSATPWQAEFAGLPKYDAQGALIAYTVAEDVPEGYVLDQHVRVGSTHILVNRYTPDMARIEGVKVWSDSEEVTHDNASEIRFIIERSEESEPREADWVRIDPSAYQVAWNDDGPFAITGLPLANAAGTEYAYRVSEEDMEGYESAIIFEDGLWKITNTAIAEPPTLTITAEKVWQGDSEHPDARRAPPST